MLTLDEFFSSGLVVKCCPRGNEAMMHESDNVKRELRRRQAAYQRAKRRGLESLKRGLIDDVLYWFYTAAQIGWHYHCGQWVDPEMEQALRQIATVICGSGPAGSSEAEPDKKRIVHLTSSVSDAGGHTEIIMNWIDLLADCGGIDQFFVSSELYDSPPKAPNKLRSISAAVKCSQLSPKGMSPSQRVRWIYQQIMQIRPDKVILYIYPNDVFSACAVAALGDSLELTIVFYDHADHVFNVGMSFAHYVVDCRIEGARYTKWYRGIEPERILLVPLWSRPRWSPAITRAALGLPEQCTVSITISSYYKLKPDGHWDFGQAIHDLLSSEADHYHLIVGDGSESDRQVLLSRFNNAPASVCDRLIWLGRRTDIDALLNIADFLIESFPMAGGVVRVEAMLARIPIVAIRNERWPLMSETDALPQGYPLVAISNEDVVRFSRMLIADHDMRSLCQEQLAKHYQLAFSRSALLSILGNVLSSQPQNPSLCKLDPRPPHDLHYMVRVALGGQVPDFHLLARDTAANIRYTPRKGVSDLLAALKHCTRRRLSRMLGQFRSTLASC